MDKWLKKSKLINMAAPPFEMHTPMYKFYQLNFKKYKMILIPAQYNHPHDDFPRCLFQYFFVKNEKNS